MDNSKKTALSKRNLFLCNCNVNYDLHIDDRGQDEGPNVFWPMNLPTCVAETTCSDGLSGVSSLKLKPRVEGSVLLMKRPGYKRQDEFGSECGEGE